MKEYAFLVIVQASEKNSEVKIYDGTQELDVENPIAKGAGATWRGALGVALEQIDIKTGEENES
jgi:hypothetical protein